MVDAAIHSQCCQMNRTCLMNDKINIEARPVLFSIDRLMIRSKTSIILNRPINDIEARPVLFSIDRLMNRSKTSIILNRPINDIEARVEANR